MLSIASRIQYGYALLSEDSAVLTSLLLRISYALAHQPCHREG